MRPQVLEQEVDLGHQQHELAWSVSEPVWLSGWTTRRKPSPTDAPEYIVGRRWLTNQVFVVLWHSQMWHCNTEAASDDVISAFNALASEWQRDTQFASSVSDMVIHPSYQQIIGMGEKVVPVLLRELERRPHHWFWALKAITRQDPVPEEARGHFDAMVAAWLQWGRTQGYID
jgi:hypothetical protein